MEPVSCGGKFDAFGSCKFRFEACLLGQQADTVKGKQANFPASGDHLALQPGRSSSRVRRPPATLSACKHGQAWPVRKFARVSHVADDIEGPELNDFYGDVGRAPKPHMIAQATADTCPQALRRLPGGWHSPTKGSDKVPAGPTTKSSLSAFHSKIVSREGRHSKIFSRSLSCGPSTILRRDRNAVGHKWPVANAPPAVDRHPMPCRFHRIAQLHYRSSFRMYSGSTLPIATCVIASRLP